METGYKLRYKKSISLLTNCDAFIDCDNSYSTLTRQSKILGYNMSIGWWILARIIFRNASMTRTSVTWILYSTLPRLFSDLTGNFALLQFTLENKHKRVNKCGTVFAVVGCPVLVFPCGTFSVLHECSPWVTWATTTEARQTCKKKKKQRQWGRDESCLSANSNGRKMFCSMEIISRLLTHNWDSIQLCFSM